MRSVQGDRTGVGGDVGIGTVETDIAAVGDIDLANASASKSVHDFNLIGTVDDSIEFGAVKLQVIAHITEFFGHIRIGLGIDIAAISSCGIIIVVHGCLIGTHIALIK